METKVKKENTGSLVLPVDTVPSNPDEELEATAPKNHGKVFLFKALCDDVFHQLELINSLTNEQLRNRGVDNRTDLKYKTFRNFYQSWRQNVGNNIYPTWQLIFPDKDITRTYGMAKVTTLHYILEILKISRKTQTWEDAHAWDRTDAAKDKGRLAFIDKCMEIITARRKLSKGGELTIDDVNDLLSRLSDAKGKEERLEVLEIAMEKMSVTELRYFLIIILKESVTFKSEAAAFFEWHPNAREYYQYVLSLKKVAYRLHDKNEIPDAQEMSITLGNPFLPQLSGRPRHNYSAVAQQMRGEFIIEEKMDGERLIVHWMNGGNDIKYFSRKGSDYTFMYGHCKSEGRISNYINIKEGVQNCILDAEIIAYDPLTNKFLPYDAVKGVSGTVNWEDSDPNDPRPFLMVFDVLLVNNTNLTKRSLLKRKKVLDQILIPTEGHVEIIQKKITKSAEDIQTVLRRCIESGSEGLVVKGTRSVYTVNRRSEQWIKIKPEYLQEFGDNLDLVVIGREKGLKDVYHCGLRSTAGDTYDENGDIVAHDTKFLSFCSIANGFDKEMRMKIDEDTRGKWHNMKKELPPPHLIQFKSKKPVEWIDPTESIVLEVKARSVDRRFSNKYAVDTTLLNAVCRKLRPDKDWKTAATVDSYLEQKRNARNSDRTQTLMIEKKRKKLILKRQRETQDEVEWNDPNTIGTQSSLFQDFLFMILSDVYYQGRRVPQEEFRELLRSHGARIIESENLADDLKTFRIVTSKNTVQVVALRGSGYDILRTSWIYDCIRMKRIVKIAPSHLFSCSETMVQAAARRVDVLGHVYEDDYDESSLEQLLTNPKNVGYVSGLSYDSSDIELEQTLQSALLFGDLTVYIVHSDDDSDYDFRCLKMMLEGFGATITNSSSDCNLVVTVSGSNDVMKKVNKVREELAKQAAAIDVGYQTVRLVSSSWVIDSVQNGYKMDEQDYYV